MQATKSRPQFVWFLLLKSTCTWFKQKILFPILTIKFIFDIIPCITIMAPQVRLKLHDPFKTLNDIFEHNIHPPEIRNAWAQIRIHCLTASCSSANAPNDILITTALWQIHKRLLLIEKSLSTYQNTANVSLSYADALKAPAPATRALSEKLVPRRLLN